MKKEIKGKNSSLPSKNLFIRFLKFLYAHPEYVVGAFCLSWLYLIFFQHSIFSRDQWMAVLGWSFYGIAFVICRSNQKQIKKLHEQRKKDQLEINELTNQVFYYKNKDILPENYLSEKQNKKK